MTGSDPISYAVRGRYGGGTWVSFELLIQIAQSYDFMFAWKISVWFKKQCIKGEFQVKQLQMNMQKQKPKVVLHQGPYLYGYLCNGILKAGDSLMNVDGSHKRTNSHGSSVPRLSFGYIIYLDSEHIIKFRSLFKEKFQREQNNREHFLCTVHEAESFVVQYCKLMSWDYACLSKIELDVYNNSL